MTFFADPNIHMINKMFFKEKPADPKVFEPLEVPETIIGSTIPVLFGTRPIQQPLLAWYGDVKIVKVKVSTKGKK